MSLQFSRKLIGFRSKVWALAFAFASNPACERPRRYPGVPRGLGAGTWERAALTRMEGGACGLVRRALVRMRGVARWHQ
eukprot:2619479-Rhodomonas_salina.1